MEPLRHDDPERVRDYRLVARLGAGGMGIVYLGLSPAGRAVAVKVIRPRFAGDDAFRARFRREAAAARTVTGAFTAAVLDADPEATQPCLVTAYLPGVTLREAVATHGALPPPAVRTLAAGLAEALAGIHHAGLTHRDLKPGNIMLTHSGPRVIDFGIARPDDATAITHTGTVLGTPGFMAPEQVRGTVAGPLADVFALGAVLAFAATGREPFGTGDTRAVLNRVTTATADLTGITDHDLLDLITACLRIDPTTRPPATTLLDRFGHAGDAVRAGGWVPGGWVPGGEEAARAGGWLAAPAPAPAPPAPALSPPASAPAPSVPAPTPSVPAPTPLAPAPAPPAPALTLLVPAPTPSASAPSPSVPASAPSASALTPSVPAPAPSVPALSPPASALSPSVPAPTPSVSALTPSVPAPAPPAPALSPPASAPAPPAPAPSPPVPAPAPSVSALTPPVPAPAPPAPALSPSASESAPLAPSPAPPAPTPPTFTPPPPPTPASGPVGRPSAAWLGHPEATAGTVGWLPAPVAEAIDRRAAAARILLDPVGGGERPPPSAAVANEATVDPSFSLPAGKPARVGRRAVLFGGATLVTAGVAGVVALTRDSTARPPTATTPPVTSSSVPTGPVREWQVLVSNSVVEMDFAGGVVIASSWSTGGIRALDPEDGALVWQRDAEVVTDTAGDTAFLVNPTGWRVSAVDAATGTEKWAFEPPPGEVSRSAVVAGDVVCFGNDLLRAIGAADGQPRWTVDLDPNRGFIAEGDVLVWTSLALGSETGRITGVDINTGQVRWSFDIPQQPADPRAANGMAYICDAEGTIRAVRAADGVVMWQQPGLGSSGPPWLTADANAMYYSADGEIRAYAATTGAPLWTRPIGRRTGESDVYSIVDKSAIMLAGDTLYAVSNEAHLYALDVADGSLRWDYPDTVRAWQVVGADGLLFVGTFDGHVEAIRPPRGG